MDNPKSIRKVIETPRLYLREFVLNDAENIWELNSDPEVLKYTGDPPFETIEKAREFINNYREYKKTALADGLSLLKTPTPSLDGAD